MRFRLRHPCARQTSPADINVANYAPVVRAYCDSQDEVTRWVWDSGIVGLSLTADGG